jgi:Cft2 family RNA processing exonuclease
MARVLPSMQVEFHADGIHLPELGLWLDCTEDCAAAWISHAHGDHAAGLHGHIFATAPTIAAYLLRTPEANGEMTAVEFGESWEFNGARLTAFPASHIVGSAQLLIEVGGERLVYTGDIKLRAPICGMETDMIPCDHLIIESTFGLPIYRFIDREEARERIVACAREAFDSKLTPVFIGYSLGRGQEIAHALCEAGIPVAVHGAIARFIPMYEAAGYAFRGWRPYNRGDVADAALVVTPEFRNVIEAGGRPVRIAYVSGWARLDNARARAGAEELIPYSDHADFNELLAIVERSGARRIDVVHGYTDPFAGILRDRGFNARAPLPLAARGAVESQEG